MTLPRPRFFVVMSEHWSEPLTATKRRRGQGRGCRALGPWRSAWGGESRLKSRLSVTLCYGDNVERLLLMLVGMLSAHVALV